jgi:hypothetical protein
MFSSQGFTGSAGSNKPTPSRWGVKHRNARRGSPLAFKWTRYWADLQGTAVSWAARTVAAQPHSETIATARKEGWPRSGDRSESHPSARLQPVAIHGESHRLFAALFRLSPATKQLGQSLVSVPFHCPSHAHVASRALATEVSRIVCLEHQRVVGYGVA